MSEPIRKTVGFVRLVPPEEWMPQRIAEEENRRRAASEEAKRAQPAWRKVLSWVKELLP